MNLQLFSLSDVSVHTLSNTPINTDDLIEIFVKDRGIRKSSKEAYSRSLKQYFKWVKMKGYHLPEISKSHINEYKDWLFESGKRSLTVISYLTAVSVLYQWGETNNYFKDITKGLEIPKRIKQFKKQPLGNSQAGDLIAATDNPRDKALIMLLLSTGLRAIEVRRANIGDITFRGGRRVLLVHGKGRDEKDAFVIIAGDVWSAIKDYLGVRGSFKENDPLFTSISPNNFDGRLTTRSISRIVKEHLKDIGLNDRVFSCHSLRHTMAINILKVGSFDDARLALRHSDPATTLIYTAFTEDERRLESRIEERIMERYLNN